MVDHLQYVVHCYCYMPHQAIKYTVTVLRGCHMPHARSTGGDPSRFICNVQQSLMPVTHSTTIVCQMYAWCGLQTNRTILQGSLRYIVKVMHVDTLHKVAA